MGDNAILGGAFPGYGIYECADGHVALGALESHFFVSTLEIFGADGTYESLRTAFSGKTIAELEAIAAEADIPLNGVK
ncbi:Predicted acyl-CoA transferases/carnitine dehydratase [Mycobacteroides abscessus]|nr:Predicted acyl-CoA transferases/carnitine dehydratase [Mycobacteroides abscessus]